MKINVRVVPNSGRQEVQKLAEKNYKVWLKKIPENNKANDELVKVLKKYFGKEILIVRGFNSRDKILEVR